MARTKTVPGGLNELLAAARGGDTEARNAVAVRYLTAAGVWAKRYQRSGNYHDLVHEGFFGILKAIEGYDPTRGQPFVSWATLYSKAYISQAAAGMRPGLPSPRTHQAVPVRDVPFDVVADDDHARRVDDLDEVEHILAGLTRYERDLLTRRYGLGGAGPQSQREIGESLGIDQSTVSDHEKEICRGIRTRNRRGER